MFSRSQRRIVCSALPVRHRGAYGASWHLCDTAFVPGAELVSGLSRSPRTNTALESATLLRGREDKDVLRLAIPNSENGSVIAKVFRLRDLSRRFRYQILGYNRFGLSEAFNLIVAAKRGLNVPRVWGYGYVRGSSGLTKTSMVMLEDLAPCVSVGEALAESAGDQECCLDILRRVTPIFKGLFRASCNHVDVNLGAVLLDTRSSQTAFLVDFEHAVFGDRPNLKVLAFEAAYFARACSKYVQRTIARQWFAELLDAAAIIGQSERATITDHFDHYLGVSLSRKDRRRIG